MAAASDFPRPCAAARRRWWPMRPTHPPRAAPKPSSTPWPPPSPPTRTPTLLDELPCLAGQLHHAPVALIEDLLNALDIQVLYRPEQHQATFLATLTDTTPATINALLNDPRTGTTQTTPPPAAPPPMQRLPQGPITTVTVHDHAS